MKASRSRNAGGLSTLPDWHAVRAAIHDIENLAEMPRDEGFHAYQRLQKILGKRGPPDAAGQRRLRDKTLDIADTFNLGWRAAIILLVKLADLEVCHSVSKEWNKQPRKGTIAMRLGKIEKSIHRISEFPREGDASNDEAIRYLITAGNRWAKKQQPALLRELGFKRFHGKTHNSNIETTDYGASQIIRQWFELAPVIENLVHYTQFQLNKPERQLSWLPEEDSDYNVPMLSGKHLPALYLRVTGKKYGVTRRHPKSGEDAYVEVVRGVKFVLMAMKAMGLDEPSPETISRYWTSKGKST